ncbi:hypothetical protein BRADI_1g33055v3 [Brachypodium distachyon]|uniref:RNase H type-1 domain-containing protein n=2 Tax=Brachypodium distachyon TaxID=15368 RepID=A0A2K2DMG8_BRADI|nr:hypothetical protein BRADI_1g33055v3 [Brachypodium distachyon]
MHVGGGGGSLWRKPEAGRLKLNFDGSSRQHVSSRSASIGGVVRDHEGRFVLGYAERIGKGSTSSVAELAALKRGLELALEHGWRGRALWVEGDAMAAVDAARGKGRRRVVSGRAEEDRRLCVEIAEMLPLLETDDEEEEDGGIMVVSHVGRAGNTVAHGFARLGHGAARPKVWRGVPPAEVMKHLHRDAQGE